MSNNFCIRDYRAEDFPQIEQLWSLTGLGGAPRGDNVAVIAQTLLHGGIFLVMEAVPSNAVIGSSWLTTDRRRTYLHHFGIAPDWQGQGLGKALLTASLARARVLKLQIKLEVHRDNKAAIALYKCHGFKYLGDYCTAPSCLDQTLASCSLPAEPSLANFVGCVTAELF